MCALSAHLWLLSPTLVRMSVRLDVLAVHQFHERAGTSIGRRRAVPAALPTHGPPHHAHQVFSRGRVHRKVCVAAVLAVRLCRPKRARRGAD